MEEAQATTITIDEPSKGCSSDDSVPESVAAASQRLSLVDIHRAVLSRLFPSDQQRVPSGSTEDESIESLKIRLNRLKRKRLHLACELERNKNNATLTVSDELNDWHSRERRPHDHVYDLNGGLRSKPMVNDTILAQDLADRMHALRAIRRIAGSHRLAGISVIPCADANVLGIRMDMCVYGRYVNRYYLFFDIVETEAQQQCLRLVQHTVPQGIPLQLIAAATLGEEGMMLPTTGCALDMDRVRRCIGEIYDACYCHAVRQDASDFLKSNESFSNVKCSNTVDSISFRWIAPKDSDAPDMQVQLEYSDPFLALPTCVNVSRVATPTNDTIASDPPGTGNNLVHVSDEEDHHDIFDTAKDAFLTCGIREAMDRIMQSIDVT